MGDSIIPGLEAEVDRDALAMFNAIDANGDGCLTAEELNNHLADFGVAQVLLIFPDPDLSSHTAGGDRPHVHSYGRDLRRVIP